MAEAIKPITYSPKDLATTLLKANGIHEGHWMLLVKFGFSAMNVGTRESGDDALPAGLISVNEIGIQNVPEPILSAVDASVVNPREGIISDTAKVKRDVAKPAARSRKKIAST